MATLNRPHSRRDAIKALNVLLTLAGSGVAAWRYSDFGAAYATGAGEQRSSVPGYAGLSGLTLYELHVPDQPIPFASGIHSFSEQSGLYGQVQLKLTDPTTLLLGERASWYSSKSRSIFPAVGTWVSDRSVSRKFTPYSSLVHALIPATSLYVSYSDVFVPQTQLTYDGAALRPRQGRQYEVGSEKSSLVGDGLHWSLAVFHMHDENRAVDDPAHPGFRWLTGASTAGAWKRSSAAVRCGVGT